MFKQQHPVIAESEVIERKPAPPSLGEGSLQQHQQRFQYRQQRHTKTPGKQHPAPGAKLDLSPFATFAGLRNEALAGKHQLLHANQRHRYQQQRNGIGRRDFHPHRVFKKLPKLCGHHIDAGGNTDDGRRAEKGDGFEKDQNEATQDGRPYQGQRHLTHGGPGTRAHDISGILHFG